MIKTTKHLLIRPRLVGYLFGAKKIILNVKETGIGITHNGNSFF